MTETSVKYSVVVPLYNEQSVVQELYERLTKVMKQTGKSYELVLVDDGSSETSAKSVLIPALVIISGLQPVFEIFAVSTFDCPSSISPKLKLVEDKSILPPQGWLAFLFA